MDVGTHACIRMHTDKYIVPVMFHLIDSSIVYIYIHTCIILNLFTQIRKKKGVSQMSNTQVVIDVKEQIWLSNVNIYEFQ